MHLSKIDGAFYQSIEGCFCSSITNTGLTDSEMSKWIARADQALIKMRKDYKLGKLPLLNVARDIETVTSNVEQAYKRLAKNAQKIVFFGTGGSNLGGQTLAQFGGWGIPGLADKQQHTRPQTRFYGNLDPITMNCVVNQDDLASQRFVLISKSGNTPETLSQAIAILDAVRKAGLEDQIPAMFLGIADPVRADNEMGLRALCREFGIQVLDHPLGIGGRFAILTSVGLLPAVARGLDIRQLLAGAQAAISNALTTEKAENCPAAAGAAVAVALYRERTAHVQVLMPYADRLAQLARWYVQLWAESVGKNGQGTTPLACLGPLDQHSQLQLFMDGPNEHYLTFVRIPSAGTGPRLPKDLAALAGLGVMAEKTIGDLVDAQTVAVPKALSTAGRPVRIIELPKLDEFALGALLMHFMLETIIAADLIGVDPFGQPAVELGKKLTRQHLADQG